MQFPLRPSEVWIHRTNRGRVVYGRKKHLFYWTDIKRILDNLPDDPTASDQRIVKILSIILKKLFPGFVVDLAEYLLPIIRAMVEQMLHDFQSEGTLPGDWQTVKKWATSLPRESPTFKPEVYNV